MKPELVLEHKCLLGEGALWDHHQQAICWVDILNSKIHQLHPREQKHRVYDVKEMVGTIALTKDGNFVAALKDGISIVDRHDASIRWLVHPEVHLPGNRYNDGKCDPQGRLWVGSIGLKEEQGAASLYRIDTDLSFKKMISSVTISNGMAWSRDYSTYYYIDTPTLQVWAFDFDITSGEITNKRIAVKVPREDGFPDGMTIDTEGMLWIAHWDGWQVARWNPNTGQKLHAYKLPVANVSSCAFGGEKLSDLYITTASKGLTTDQLENQPLAGSLFVVRDCGHTGVPTFEFGK